MSKTKQRLRRSEYLAQAKSVRDHANSDASTMCRLCGEPGRDGDPWVAYRGSPLGIDELVPTHRSCSCSAGAKQWRQQALPSTPEPPGRA